MRIDIKLWFGAGAILCALVLSPGCAQKDPADEGFSLEVVKVSPETVEVDLKALKWDPRTERLFRSSSFYRPRTDEGARIYMEEFPQHDTGRTIKVEWELSQSFSKKDYIRRLKAGDDFFTELFKAHEKVIVVINLTPDWLSPSHDFRDLEAYWERRNTFAPEDMDQWAEVVRETAEYFAKFEREPGVEKDADAEIYYEVWNEPDLYYWSGTLEEYLALYDVTARTLRETDPLCRVGGATVNQWNGKINASPDSNWLNAELIRHAAEAKIPLDFVSWHHFSSHPEKIGQVRKCYEAECKKAGLSPMPQFVVSEWNLDTPARQTGFTTVLMAETMANFVLGGVDLHTFSTWEDFHPEADDGGWGLIRQGGEPRTSYLAYRAFDELTRNAEGVTLIGGELKRKSAGQWRTAIAGRGDGVYDMIFWINGADPALGGAIEVIEESGLSPSGVFGEEWVLDDVRKAMIETGDPPAGLDQEVFDFATQAFRSYPPTTPVKLVLPGVATVEIENAEGVSETSRALKVDTQDNVLSFALGRYEMALLKIRVEEENSSVLGRVFH